MLFTSYKCNQFKYIFQNKHIKTHIFKKQNPKANIFFKLYNSEDNHLHFNKSFEGLIIHQTNSWKMGNRLDL